MINLTELREMITENAAFIPTDEQSMLRVLNIAIAAKRHSDSFNNAHGVLIVDVEKQTEVNEAAERLDKLLKDVEVDDA